jgi:hypothetical protein
VAIKPRDGKFSTFTSAFEEQHLAEFVESIRMGFARVQGVQGELGPIHSTQPWDGQDAAVQMEEEVSLDDLKDV